MNLGDAVGCARGGQVTRPTKDVGMAMIRIRRAADERGLIAFGAFHYRGDIAGDLLAVLNRLEACLEQGQGAADAQGAPSDEGGIAPRSQGQAVASVADRTHRQRADSQTALAETVDE
jgi:hypothetical protein